MSHQPKRGDDVEAWIKRARDELGPTDNNAYYHPWFALDQLLDDYRAHADTGTPLSEEVREHDTTGGF